MMHQIGQALSHHDCRYTPFYADGLLGWLTAKGALDFTIMGPGGGFRRMTDAYLLDNRLPVDFAGRHGPYDLILTCSDLIVPRNLKGRTVVLVQEGMTDPPDMMYHLVRRFGLPRWLASTSTTGLSGAFRKFCVASDGYRDFFAANGIPPERLVVTGIPNFDNCRSFLDNDFPFRDYVLVATSDTRETFKHDDRHRFFDRVASIAAGRPLLFKLHPNENAERSSAEIRARFPEALIYTDGNTNNMVANCRVLVTQYSSVVYVGLALGKECHSYFDLDQLRQLLPWQNGGVSAANIARVCERLLRERPRPSLRVPLLAEAW